MRGITVTVEAYEAIKATLPADTSTWPTKPAFYGDVVIQLDQATVDRLDALRAPGESYSAVILRVNFGAQRFNGASQSSTRAPHEFDDTLDLPPTEHPGRELFTASLFALVIITFVIWGVWKLISLM
jgi:hypothetical protein